MSARALRFIAFRVGAETFLIDIMAVRQIVMAGKTTSVPTAPSFIEGVIVYRNEVIPVVDVHARLYPQRQAAGERTLILLTHTIAGVIGLKVSEVRRIVTLSSEELLPAPATVRGVRGEFLVAIAPHGEEVFLVLDVDHLLTGDEQRQLASLTPGA
ncbi:MAG TPA: chemotaxis protein CheW [Thermoanaerobaculia bacterium]|nr:chemotaxis protein CheW [Thermoanaerobaculia bacterium]